MKIKAVLLNAKHREYGVASVPFPIEQDVYDETIELLRPLEIGGATEHDCYIEEISGITVDVPILKRLEKVAVNLDELDYLIKRMDSFDNYELTQFQGMAAKLGIFSIDQLIDLTFCCQEATVISDFTNLEAVGQRHYLTVNGCVPADELERVNGVSEAKKLISYEVGHVTPFGVVYDNGMQLKHVYRDLNFPEYRWQDSVMEVEPRSQYASEDSDPTYLYLPMTQTQLERAMLRAHIDNYGDASLYFLESVLPDEIEASLCFERENLSSLNELCHILSSFRDRDLKKLAAVVELAKPEYASQLRQLAENIDQFDFAPGIQTPEEYGRYMIIESERYFYDENLDEYYDFTKYGEQHMEQEYGAFTGQGYVSYHGTLSLDELMMEDPDESMGFQMGGMEMR